MPSNSPKVKADGIRALGADVTVVDGYYDEALEASRARAEESGALVLHAYDQPEVVAGQGTVGAELAEQSPDADTVLVAIGGGGLIGGIGAWYEGRTRVIGVEPETSTSMTAALAAGRPVDVTYGGYAADSLGTKRAGEIAFEIVSKHVERIVLVSGDQILEAQRRLWQEVRIFAEPGGAAALAALLSGAYVAEPGEHVVAGRLRRERRPGGDLGRLARKPIASLEPSVRVLSTNAQVGCDRTLTGDLERPDLQRPDVRATSSDSTSSDAMPTRAPSLRRTRP